jgi:hypothetical protein
VREPPAGAGFRQRVQPEAVLVAPARRQLEQRRGAACLQFEFDLQHRQRVAAGTDLAAVEGDLDRAAGCLDGARQPRHVGFERGLQFALGTLQCCAQRSTDRVAVVARGVRLRRLAIGHRRVVLQPVERAAAGALGRLHPLAALLPQPQDQRFPRQRLVGRVEVARAQPLAVDLATPQGRVDLVDLVGRHLELELEFGHRSASFARFGAAGGPVTMLS